MQPSGRQKRMSRREVDGGLRAGDEREETGEKNERASRH